MLVVDTYGGRTSARVDVKNQRWCHEGTGCREMCVCRQRMRCLATTSSEESMVLVVEKRWGCRRHVLGREHDAGREETGD